MNAQHGPHSVKPAPTERDFARGTIPKKKKRAFNCATNIPSAPQNFLQKYFSKISMRVLRILTPRISHHLHSLKDDGRSIRGCHWHRPRHDILLCSKLSGLASGDQFVLFRY